MVLAFDRRRFDLERLLKFPDSISNFGATLVAAQSDGQMRKLLDNKAKLQQELDASRNNEARLQEELDACRASRIQDASSSKKQETELKEILSTSMKEMGAEMSALEQTLLGKQDEIAGLQNSCVKLRRTLEDHQHQLAMLGEDLMKKDHELQESIHVQERQKLQVEEFEELKSKLKIRLDDLQNKADDLRNKENELKIKVGETRTELVSTRTELTYTRTELTSTRTAFRELKHNSDSWKHRVTCVVCFGDTDVLAVSIQCCHQCVCAECLDTVLGRDHPQCPMCRTDVLGIGDFVIPFENHVG